MGDYGDNETVLNYNLMKRSVEAYWKKTRKKWQNKNYMTILKLFCWNIFRTFTKAILSSPPFLRPYNCFIHSFRFYSTGDCRCFFAYNDSVSGSARSNLIFFHNKLIDVNVWNFLRSISIFPAIKIGMDQVLPSPHTAMIHVTDNQACNNNTNSPPYSPNQSCCQ